MPPLLCAAGNEAAVPKAVNTSGLLWELARDLGAVLVFAEVGFASAARHKYRMLCSAGWSASPRNLAVVQEGWQPCYSCCCCGC